MNNIVRFATKIRSIPESQNLKITLLILIIQTAFWIHLRHFSIRASPSHGSVLYSTTSEKSQHSSMTIFYNVFFGNDQNLTLSIIREQMDIISQNHHLYNATIQFVVIGNNTFYPTCKNQICNVNKRLDTGDEVSTLQLLHDHCLERRNEQVIYLHSKGSFHRTPENDLLRPLLTRAAVSKECVLQNHNSSTNVSSSCNICSSRFSPYPHWHAAGNMFRASCEYIAKLLPPVFFSTMMDNMIQTVKAKKRIKRNLACWKLGCGRYSAEHWAHTHPDVIPCDVYQGKFVWGNDDLEESMNESTRQVQVMKAPRFSRNFYFKNSLHIKPYFFGKDYRLLELEILYGKEPPNSSWFWSFYESN
jgi:hypothetical protein